MTAASSLDLTVERLLGAHVRLDSFAPAHRDPVGAALASDPDALAVTSSNYGPAGFADWWAARSAAIAAGTEHHFAVRRLADDTIVGSTSYLNLRPKDRGCEIGHTFYRPDARAGPINPECKLLLLRHAFDCGALRVEFRTDALNAASRAAIAKLGARQEAVLRRHGVTWTGRIRDTVVFAILDEDWPSVRANLEARLAAFAPRPPA